MLNPESVEELLDRKEGTVLLIVNSVCGCAAGNARPAVKMTKNFNPKVDVFATVFAGQDIGATAKAREYMLPYPPSSPSIAVFKNGTLVHFIERHHIEGRSADIIAENLKACFQEIC
jgi:putative YphP/YqiW family bacilliredoxin